MKLAYNPQNKKYYTNEEALCDVCEQSIIVGIYRRAWNRNGYNTKNKYHPHCYKRSGDDLKVEHKFMVVKELPIESVPVLDLPPQLQVSGGFMEYADWKGRVIDRTKLAGRESIGGASVGVSLPSDSPVLLGEEVNEYLDEVKKWKRVEGLEVVEDDERH